MVSSFLILAATPPFFVIKIPFLFSISLQTDIDLLSALQMYAAARRSHCRTGRYKHKALGRIHFSPKSNNLEALYYLVITD